jgi:hypothetical protein
MDNVESKPNIQDMHEGAYPKKRRSVLLASLPRSSIGHKRIAGQVLGPFLFLAGFEISRLRLRFLAG